MKSSTEPAASRANRSEPPRAEGAKTQTESPQQAKDKPPVPPADLARSPLSETDLPPSGVDGLNQRAEVNQSALEFAKNFPDVRAVKTCYSKLYGGWNLDLFVGTGKKIGKQQFSWNNKSKEWELTSYAKKEVPIDQLDYYLDTELADEKCFVLKK